MPKEEIEFPFTVTVTAGEPKGTRAEESPSERRSVHSAPEHAISTGIRHAVGLIGAVVVTLMLAVLLVGLVRGTILYWDGPLSRYADASSTQASARNAPHVSGIPAGQHLVRITDPEKASRCTGRLVRDNDSPKCHDVPEGRWCPNKCEPW